MLDTILNHNKPNPIPLPPAEVTEPTPAARLAAIHAEVAALREKVNTTVAELDRVRAVANSYREPQVLPAAAKATLETLHARRTAGEDVTDAQISAAEHALRAAHEGAQRAESAEAGARTVVARLTATVDQMHAKVAAARARAMPLLREILMERAVRSMAQHRRDAEAYANGKFAAHHAEIAAITEFAQANGLGALPVFTHPNAGARWLEIACTPTPEAYLDSAYGFDLGAEIDSQAARVADELQSLLP